MVEITPGQAKVWRTIGDEEVTGEDIRRMLKLNHSPTNHIRGLLKAGLLEVVGVRKVNAWIDSDKPMYIKARVYKTVKGAPFKVVDKSRGHRATKISS